MCILSLRYVYPVSCLYLAYVALTLTLCLRYAYPVFNLLSRKANDMVIYVIWSAPDFLKMDGCAQAR